MAIQEIVCTRVILQCKYSQLTVEKHIQNDIIVGNHVTIARTKEILENFGILFDDYLSMSNHFVSHGKPCTLQDKAHLIITLLPLLELMYYTEYGEYLNIFLACFGGYDKPREWWEYIARLHVSYPFTSNDKPVPGDLLLAENISTDDPEDMFAEKETLLYAWTLQILMGLCGIDTFALLGEHSILLE